MPTAHPLADFHPVVRRWFESSFGEPSPPQLRGWPSISAGNNTLILAPTGSGKTLAAFLWAINHLVEERLAGDIPPGVRILYISPLKALNNDIHRNLEEPLRGIREEARTAGLQLPAIRTAVRTGDTPQSKRAAMLRHPPDILITTPESLYLMLTAKRARPMFRTVQYVIVDEIHSICGNKRGVHLSISLERLQAVADQEFVRIGLSATQRPLETVAAFLGGQSCNGKNFVSRPVTIVDAGQRKRMDLQVECAPPDFSVLPQESVWPLVFAELLTCIRTHTTTLIFVNNRRLAERVAATLNEMISGNEDTFNLYAVPRPSGHGETAPTSPSGKDLVQAYHGSMSRHARERMEEELKGGRLRALVATSSLELGIDIGSIDLVVQLQSPKGIARGLQRVGRSGHLVTATSKGRIFPTYREDLVESTVVAKAMMEHDVEHTSIPLNCLDVLAQQVVAAVSVEEWSVDALFDLVRQSYCYKDLPAELFRNVLRMLAGRYSHETLRELRARISWDKVNDTLRALPGTSRLAITNSGTISDRGYFGVYLEDGKTKVGEVDEEFVYESRVGDTFFLGTSVWRMIGLDHSRLTVVPAPGQPARMPFWRGEGIGRSFELSKKVGRFRGEMDARITSPSCLAWLQNEFPIDPRAAWNLQEYFRRQQEICGHIPHDRLLLVEGFRDEIGDPRIVVHSSFGRRVNGLLGMVLALRLHARVGVEPQLQYNDDGILLRCPDVDVLPLELLGGITFSEAGELVLDEILSSSLFGGQFRQNAARALLMPKVAPGKRTPLWLQRLRAGDLLQVARQFEDFPIVIETVREVLNDVLDFEHFKDVLRDIENGTIRVVTVQTEVPSPFAASLLFDFIAVYMYEWDEPRADKQSRYLAVNRELLAEVVDLDSMKDLLRPEAFQEVENRLQHKTDGTRARSPEELMELLLRLGDLTEEEIRERTEDHSLRLLHALGQDGRAVAVQFEDGKRWIAGEDHSLYDQIEDHTQLQRLLLRYLQHRGPTTAQQIAQRFDLQPTVVEQQLDEITGREQVIKGKFLEGGESGRGQWCYRPNLERVHRQTISILRKEIHPSSLQEFTNFLLHWQHVHPASRLKAVEGVRSCVGQLQGLALPSDIWEREILSRRVPDLSHDDIERMTSSGELVWVGTGSGRSMPLLRGEGNTFLPPLENQVSASMADGASKILAALTTHGASFFDDLRTATRLSLETLNGGLAELFWAGLITNDVFSELASLKRSLRAGNTRPTTPIRLLTPAHNPARARYMQAARRAIKQVPGWSGRWSLVRSPGVLGEHLEPEEIAARQARQLLERYGIVARELYRRETLLPWPAIAAELQRMEMRGEIRRGYFVEGLSGMQYAHPAAVDELRRQRSGPAPSDAPVLVNACDPANPFGPGVVMSRGHGPSDDTRVARTPRNYLVFHNGAPILLIEGLGIRLWTLAESSQELVETALREFVGMTRFPAQTRPFREIVVEQCDGARPTEAPLGRVLTKLGFYRDRNQTLRYDTVV